MKFIANKRPIFPVKYNESDYSTHYETYDDTPLECIELLSDSEDDSVMDNELAIPKFDIKRFV